MSFARVARPIQKTAAGTGMSCSLQGGRKSKKVAIGASGGGGRRLSFKMYIRPDMQASLFGGPMGGKRFNIGIGSGTDEGRLLISEHSDGAILCHEAMKGSAVLAMEAWDLLPKDARPSAAVIFVEMAGKAAIVSLPDWARPSSLSGKLAQEHGLKPIERKA